MTITIPFPTDFDASTYPEIKSFLKQMELVIHHAQKSVENAEKDGVEITEDSYVCFDHPMLEDGNLDEKELETMRGFTTDHYEDLQKVELKIVLE